MFKTTFGIVLASAVSIGGCAVQPDDAIGPNEQGASAEEVGTTSSELSGCSYLLYRFNCASQNGDHRDVPSYGGILGKGCALEANLGGVCKYPYTGGMVAVYVCDTGTGARYRDFFLSHDPGCEGRRRVNGDHLTFYLSAVQDGISHPIYRCRQHGNGEHFTALSPACEGHILEGLLGFANNTTF
jgi:hypothetical protein